MSSIEKYNTQRVSELLKVSPGIMSEENGGELIGNCNQAFSEITQDITEIRPREGRQRLPDCK